MGWSPVALLRTCCPCPLNQPLCYATQQPNQPKPSHSPTQQPNHPASQPASQLQPTKKLSNQSNNFQLTKGPYYYQPSQPSTLTESFHPATQLLTAPTLPNLASHKAAHHANSQPANHQHPSTRRFAIDLLVTDLLAAEQPMAVATITKQILRMVINYNQPEDQLKPSHQQRQHKTKQGNSHTACQATNRATPTDQPTHSTNQLNNAIKNPTQPTNSNQPATKYHSTTNQTNHRSTKPMNHLVGVR